MIESRNLPEKYESRIGKIEVPCGCVLATFHILEDEISKDCKKHNILPKVNCNRTYDLSPNMGGGVIEKFSSLKDSPEDNPLLQHICNVLVTRGHDPEIQWSDLRYTPGWSFMCGSTPIYTNLDELIKAIDFYLKKHGI